MSSETTHRAIGWLLLVAAVCTLLVATRTNGRDVRGVAIAVPPIPPPPVGTCLALSAAVPGSVPCALLHTAEVLASWPAGTSAATGQRCSGDQRSGPLGTKDDGWQPPPYSAIYRLLAADGPIGWVACVQQALATVDPVGALSYRGRLTAAVSIAEYPTELRACYWQTSAKAAAHPVSCSEPHDAELLAISNGHPPSGQNCAGLAVDLVGSAAAFTGQQALMVGELNLAATGRLTVEVGPDRVDRHLEPFVIGGRYPAEAVSNCAVRVRPGRWLIGSVVGLGRSPLPFG